MALALKTSIRPLAVFCGVLRRNTTKTTVNSAVLRNVATQTASAGRSNDAAEDLQDVQKYWNAFAEVYTNNQSKITSVIQHAVLVNMQLATAKRILEVGAGSGNSTDLLLRELATSNPNSAQCTFVTSDFSPEMVKRLKQAVQRMKAKIDNPPSAIDVQQIDVRKLPFDDESFDRYFAGLCIHLTPEWESSMREAARVLTKTLSKSRRVSLSFLHETTTKGGIAGFSIWGREDQHTFVTLSKQIVEDVCGKDLPPQPAVHSNFECARDPQRFVGQLKRAGFSRVVHWYQQACAFTGLDNDRNNLLMPLGFVTVAEMLDSLPENIRKHRTEKVEQRMIDRFSKDGLDNTGAPLIFDTLCAIAVK